MTIVPIAWVKMGKLDAVQIETYFEIHLPPRVRGLSAHYRMTHKAGTTVPKEWDGDLGQLEACYLASLVNGRMFLNLIGVGKDKNGALKPFSFEDDDVSAEDLGGKLLDVSKLTLEDNELFRVFIRMADKAAAHFTLPFDHPWERSHEAILRIYQHVNANLYEPAGRIIVPIA
jgi:hypothetical protein